jgi:hypothetical protein
MNKFTAVFNNTEVNITTTFQLAIVRPHQYMVDAFGKNFKTLLDFIFKILTLASQFVE